MDFWRCTRTYNINYRTLHKQDQVIAYSVLCTWIIIAIVYRKRGYKNAKKYIVPINFNDYLLSEEGVRVGDFELRKHASIGFSTWCGDGPVGVAHFCPPAIRVVLHQSLLHYLHMKYKVV